MCNTTMHANLKPPSFVAPWPGIRHSKIFPDAQAKQVLKEAVDAVVNSFAKHTQGYGRGEFCYIYYHFFSLINGQNNILSFKMLCIPLYFFHRCNTAIIKKLIKCVQLKSTVRGLFDE